MKYLKVLSVIILFILSNEAYSQTPKDSVPLDTSKTFIVIKNDGTEYVGKILYNNAREVLILTEKIGEIVIPKHEIKEIKEMKKEDFSATGEYIPNEVFSTRYFITTNGLPVEKGESYIQWNLYGPDVQFGIGKNFGVGVMTTWIGFPILGSAKYSIQFDKKVSLGVGTLLGTGTWVVPDFAIALPFMALTFGDRKRNINFSAGYGAIRSAYSSSYDPVTNMYYEKVGWKGRLLVSVAAMAKIGKRLSFVFDSFIMPSNNAVKNNSLAILIPGIRIQTTPKTAFQFGFGGLYLQTVEIPLPLPFIQFYMKL